MKYVILLVLLLSNQAFSQSFTERELKTRIDEVTIYVQGGLVTRTGKLEIPSGKSTLVVKSLSPHIDNKSVQVKATGDFTILSVNHKLNHLNRLKKDKQIDSLKGQVESLEFEISMAESRLQILAEQQSLLNENKKLGGENSGASLTQIKQAIDFYDRELTAIKSEEIKTRLKMRELNKEKGQIEQEIYRVEGKDELPTSEIEIRVDSKGKSVGDFKITYLVSNTGWYPKYDVRVTSVAEPIELKYKADIYQNTGVNWENVKLKLSNGDPNQSGVAPQLETWYLNYARNTVRNRSANGGINSAVRNVSGKILSESGDPIPGANILVKGMNIGTISDIDGNYSLTLPNGATHLSISFVGYAPTVLPITSERMNVKLKADVSSLEEVVVTGYGIERALPGRVAGISIRGNNSLEKKAKSVTTTTIENQTTVEFEVDEPYSVKSNGEKLSVDLNSFNIETIYEYFAVPKLDKDAFLIARIINWDQYNLLEGEANLYFEDAYVGRSILDARSLEDTLNISLGRDKSIVIGREKVDEYSKRRTIGSNKIESRGYQIFARNKKSKNIKLTLFDQIPVAVISDISVTENNLSGGKLDEKTGEVTWELNLEPQEQKELKLSYDVKYPKYEKVILE
ncbi:mucoidy inhibitor MuiA family protein [Fulvivirga maritima]|uniref:mucoidy inhibitor MuiA family protein n=1 Tax=Fulvivirga maritima TaxID=2904247 RepID=UPI001F2A0DBE|nr:mucoidy inhibitor MuiA family protein [Fulvivirga maritima]UII25125.1 mucoidy inhibitor MuiA family protein [Fulvivirga maritima]